MSIIRTQVIVSAQETEAPCLRNLRVTFQAAVLLGQLKLHVRRALIAIPADRTHIRRHLRSLAAALRIAIEAVQKLGESR